MNILALDTSSSSASIAIWTQERLAYGAYFDLQITHSETLIPQIDAGLKMSGITIQEIGLVIVAVGPGSFTGLRIGLATAKGICLANQIPILPYSSLQMLAAGSYGNQYPILSMMDAKMNEVYAALYSPTLEEIIPPQAMDPSHVIPLIQGDVFAVGSGAIKYGELLISAGLHLHQPLLLQHLPNAVALISLYHHGKPETVYDFTFLSELEPQYLRKSQAEVAREKRLGL